MLALQPRPKAILMPESRPTTWWNPLTWLIPLVLAGVCFWHALPGGSVTSVAEQPAVAAATNPSPISQKQLATVAIKDLRTGRRVLADNPELDGADVPFVQIEDPEHWRNYHLRLEKPDGSHVEITLLNPVDWLQACSTDGGKTVELELHELGAAGRAEVLAIEPCPEIEQKYLSGRPLLTGTFKHTSGKVLDLQIEGEPDVIGTTSNHPFWSEGRQAYVPAGELTIGEQLLTASGRIARLENVNSRPGTHTVYNLQVDGVHVYYVGANGALVHNSYAMHHTIPRAVRKLHPKKIRTDSRIIGKRGLPNNISVEYFKHRRIHSGRGLSKAGGYYNNRLFDEVKAITAKRKKLTVEQFLMIRDTLVREFAL